MQGEFRGDFTRDVDDPARHFQRVMLQQGRVILDADWNQAFSIVHEQLAALARAIYGPYGGPAGTAGFKIITTKDQIDREEHGTSETKDELKRKLQHDVLISPGSYYVDGLLCQNNAYVRYSEQPFAAAAIDLSAGTHLFFLEAWERMFNAAEEDQGQPGVREAALNGELPAQRSQIAWRVRSLPLDPHAESPSVKALLAQITTILSDESDLRKQEDQPTPDPDAIRRAIQALLPKKKRLGVSAGAVLQKLVPAASRVRLQASTAPSRGGTPCITPPDARYRGDSNILARLEIIRCAGDDGAPKFVWDTNNGSDEYPIVGKSEAAGPGMGRKLTLEHLGHDQARALAEGDMVELVDLGRAQHDGERSLFKVITVHAKTREVELAGVAGSPPAPAGKQILRRWRGGVIAVAEAWQRWRELGDGIQVQFTADNGALSSMVADDFRSGDYWLIPARTITGDVEWPRVPEMVWEPQALPPHGITYHYAPLGVLKIDTLQRSFVDCRFTANPQTLPVIPVHHKENGT